jgi:hypothetical protein
MDEAEIEQLLLKKLYERGCWGEKHTCESNLPKSFPSHLRGGVKDAARRLRKEGLLVIRPSSHDYQCYLNPERLDEIIQRIHGKQTSA